MSQIKAKIYLSIIHILGVFLTSCTCTMQSWKRECCHKSPYEKRLWRFGGNLRQKWQAEMKAKFIMWSNGMEWNPDIVVDTIGRFWSSPAPFALLTTLCMVITDWSPTDTMIKNLTIQSVCYLAKQNFTVLCRADRHLYSAQLSNVN